MKIHERKIVIAWDLDETLGFFVELGMLWDALETHSSRPLTNDDFFNVLDLYPEFLRPNILKVLTMIKNKKKKNKRISVIIFTNNQGPRSWTELIVAYLNHKLKYELFDEIIPAYKIGRTQVSECRTSHEKKYDDLLKCMKLPEGTQVCFIDDQNHEQMKNDNVYYINIKEYENSIPFNALLKTLEGSKIAEKLGINNKQSLAKMNELLDEYKFKVIQQHPKAFELDKVITKKLYNHIQTFIKEREHKGKKTRRNKRANSKTLKI